MRYYTAVITVPHPIHLLGSSQTFDVVFLGQPSKVSPLVTGWSSLSREAQAPYECSSRTLVSGLWSLVASGGQQQIARKLGDQLHGRKGLCCWPAGKRPSRRTDARELFVYEACTSGSEGISGELTVPTCLGTCARAAPKFPRAWDLFVRLRWIRREGGLSGHNPGTGFRACR